MSSSTSNPYPSAVEVSSFVTALQQHLRPHGFSRGRCLPIVCTCRDELAFDVKQRIAEAWGPIADVSSLGGVPVLGRSGWDAVAGHAPYDDGTQRLLVVVLPHIGVHPGPGAVRRAGQPEPSAACGALVQLGHELAEGHQDTDVHVDDAELSLLRRAVQPHLPTGPVTLPGLTEAARTASADAAQRLAGHALRDPAWDVAVVAGVLVHARDGDEIADATVSLSVGGNGLSTLPVHDAGAAR